VHEIGQGSARIDRRRPAPCGARCFRGLAGGLTVTDIPDADDDIPVMIEEVWDCGARGLVVE
jgi:hypothetical protein